MQILTLSALAEKFGLTLQGTDSPLTGLNTLEQACETEVSFLANPKYAHLLATTKALAVIVDAEHAPQVKTALISKHPYLDFAQVATLFLRAPSAFTGISEKAVVHPTAQIGEGCTIYPFCYVGAQTIIGKGTTLYPGAFIGDDCRIGEHCVLYPQATVLAGLSIGSFCTLQAGCVLGTEGFGFVRFAGTMQKIPQIGSVHLGNNVDVGANTCIDRATLNATSVGNDTKIDNLVQLGHNVTIGEQALIISQVGIAGSTQVGDRVTLAGQAGIAGHLTIANDAVVGPRAGVGKNIPANMQGAGTPFMEGSTFLRHMLLQPKIPELFNRVRQLEKEQKELKKLLATTKNKDNK